jgi:hypothetical protein
VEPSQDYSRFQHQGSQLGNEIQRPEDDLRGAITVGPLLTERDQVFMLTVGALHPQESMLQPSAFEEIGKFLFHMHGQGLALYSHITSLNPG